VASFLVEAFTPLPISDRLEQLSARARSAAVEVSRAGGSVRYVRSILLPEDQVCFHIFEGDSLGRVAQAVDLAGLEHERIVEAIVCGG